MGAATRFASDKLLISQMLQCPPHRDPANPEIASQMDFGGHAGIKTAIEKLFAQHQINPVILG
jgi:hypothetical protein